MSFLEYTKELNDKAISLQDIKEELSESDLVCAIAYLNNIYIKDIGDCLIFLSALNLCNAYVKDNKSKFSYYFKMGIEHLIDILNYNYVDGIYINTSSNNGNLYIFQVGNIQFSFHDEKKVIINDRYLKELSWDGIRKQNCCKSIFDSAINNKICVSNMTFRGKDLEKKVSRMMDNYKTGKIKLDDIKVFDYN